MSSVRTKPPLIDARLREWIARQRMFFVATAPLGPGGSVNLSPKGMDTLRVLDDSSLAWLDSGGSGVETIAHLRENGRIVIMMCAFEGPPKIWRFHGRGRVVLPGDSDFADLSGHFDRSRLGTRAIIRVAVHRVSNSCGFGVPLYEFRGHRAEAEAYLARNGVQRVRAYLARENAVSIDGLPGLSAEEAQRFDPPDFRAD